MRDCFENRKFKLECKAFIVLLTVSTCEGLCMRGAMTEKLWQLCTAIKRGKEGETQRERLGEMGVGLCQWERVRTNSSRLNIHRMSIVRQYSEYKNIVFLKE